MTKAARVGERVSKVQRGGFVLGLVVGLLVGLALALAVALYITKAPVPFINKVPQRTAEMDRAEQERNRHWDPNASLAGKAGAARPAATASSPNVGDGGAEAPVQATRASAAVPAAPVESPAAGPARSARDPAALLSGAPAAPASAARPAETFAYFVQVGAYSKADEAEQHKARLALQGLTAKISEREQAGKVVYRVRLGPYDSREQAETQQGRLQEGSSTSPSSQIVRVEKP